MCRSHYDYLIIGGGLAGATAVKELLLMGAQGSIGMLAAETGLPYERPPLSKDFLLGQAPRDSLFLLSERVYREHGVGLHLGTPAASVSPGRHLVTSAGGDEFEYGSLLIASGCAVRRLQIPGTDLPGLFYLRTLADAEALKQAIAGGGHAVVIGGGFIGLEVASALAQRDIGVTIIHRADRLFERFASEELCSFFERHYLDHGVHVVYEDEVRRLEGDGRLRKVVTRAGRTLPCDFVFAGIGVEPGVAYLEGSGIEINNGIVVNEYLQAGAPDVFAAGDVANFFDPVFGRRRRIEHWDNAITQGRLAARNMAGVREPFAGVSYFYSTVFGITYEFFGDLSGYDEMVLRGSFDRKTAALLYLGGGVLRAALLLNRPPAERRAVQQLIVSRQQIGSLQEQLADDHFMLERALA